MKKSDDENLASRWIVCKVYKEIRRQRARILLQDCPRHSRLASLIRRLNETIVSIYSPAAWIGQQGIGGEIMNSKIVTTSEQKLALSWLKNHFINSYDSCANSHQTPVSDWDILRNCRPQVVGDNVTIQRISTGCSDDWHGVQTNTATRQCASTAF